MLKWFSRPTFYIVLLMNGVAVGPFELKMKSWILTRRGGCDANAPKSSRSLCCEWHLELLGHQICGI